jgi:hypothetical protein
MSADLQQKTALRLENFFLDGTWNMQKFIHDGRLPGCIATATARVMYTFLQFMQDHARIHILTQYQALSSVSSRVKWRRDCNGGGGLLGLSRRM